MVGGGVLGMVSDARAGERLPYFSPRCSSLKAYRQLKILQNRKIARSPTHRSTGVSARLPLTFAVISISAGSNTDTSRRSTVITRP